MRNVFVSLIAAVGLCGASPALANGAKPDDPSALGQSFADAAGPDLGADISEEAKDPTFGDNFGEVIQLIRGLLESTPNLPPTTP